VAKKVIKYSPYLELFHLNFILNMIARVKATVDDSPFTDYDTLIAEDAFFGSGFTIQNFPALYDIYGKFLAGLDIDTLHSQLTESSVNAPCVRFAAAAESFLLSTDISTNVSPRLNTGSDNILSVLSGYFQEAENIVNDVKNLCINKFKKQMKYSMLSVANSRWAIHLSWNKGVVDYYSSLMELFFAVKIDAEDRNLSMAAKNVLWPFTVLDYEKAGLGALQGARTTIAKEGAAGSSSAAKVISGVAAFAGAAAEIKGFLSPPSSATKTVGIETGMADHSSAIGMDVALNMPAGAGGTGTTAMAASQTGASGAGTGSIFSSIAGFASSFFK